MQVQIPRAALSPLPWDGEFAKEMAHYAPRAGTTATLFESSTGDLVGIRVRIDNDCDDQTLCSSGQPLS